MRGIVARILLVEDDEMSADMLVRRLRRRGHEVLHATDGAQAVAMTRTDRPELVLMDMNLPVMDGWDATRRIKCRTRRPSRFRSLL
jgi:CheY-like chemotaxis protein